jgi:hypothetical protein
VGKTKLTPRYNRATDSEVTASGCSAVSSSSVGRCCCSRRARARARARVSPETTDDDDDDPYDSTASGLE